MLDMICDKLGVQYGVKWFANDGRTYMIKYEGILMLAKEGNHWEKISGSCYTSILQGRLKPVWKPKSRERYYIPRMNYEMYDDWCWVNDKNDNWWLENSMIFKTKEEAIECANRMLKTVREYQHEIS